MPIGGFVLHVRPERREEILPVLERMEGLTVYGYDDRGQIVIVLETETSEAMEKVVEEILGLEGVINCDLAYLHGENEVEKIEKGEYVPKIRFGRKPQDVH